jgi:hypothetical protein
VFAKGKFDTFLVSVQATTRYDNVRGEDLVQCLLCTGVAFGRTVAVIAVVEVATSGILQLPPPVEVGVLMVCFTFVNGAGRYVHRDLITPSYFPTV